MDEPGLTLAVAVDTHTDADHITALGHLHDRTGCQLMMGEQSLATSAKFTDEGIVHLETSL
ncbi:MAG: sulfur dioxygenase [Patiriisocius sp.]